jgi:hypothetical protein
MERRGGVDGKDGGERWSQREAFYVVLLKTVNVS